ncbi:MAG: MotA/TolQ/ExbB proton channel family protein [Myxococcales bacterium]|nr:MotA/TolQ/ExbB proton channel family protein [Myxococcales bacterium]
METDTGIDGQILDLMLRAGSRWILWLLLGLSLAALAVMIERVWFYLQERRPAELFARALDTLRKKGPADALRVLANQRSMQAAVGRSCLERAADGAAAVEDHKTAIIEQERQRYERRLAFLGTLGNNAPFVGLFGTVLGIIRAVHDLSGSSLSDTQAVMAGIAQALVATGVGLLVALPAVAAYNAFTRHVETTTSATETFAHQILAYLKTSPSTSADAKEA